MTLLMRVIFWILLVSLVNMTAWVLADKEPSCRWMGWIWYITAQFIMCFFMVLGWGLLIPFCLTHAWNTRLALSIKDPRRRIDVWDWMPLNYVYGNPEDGVSGQCALVGNADNTALVPYMPNAPAWWRAYLWCGWRNSCDALKYRFAWPNGPCATILGHKVGWFDYAGRRLPVL
jgi:hypothetical protein